MVVDMEPEGDLFQELFSEKNQKIEKCVSTAQARTDRMWAPPWSAQSPLENARIPGTILFKRKLRTITNTSVPWALLGAPLVPQSVFKDWKCIQGGPKLKKEADITPKSEPQPRRSKKLPKESIWDQGPADCAQRLQLKRKIEQKTSV